MGRCTRGALPVLGVVLSSPAAVDQERPSSLPWSLLVAVLILIFFLLFRLLTSGALLASATEAQLQASAAVVLEV